jgi:methyl-accepting chemotaxis protein
MLKNTSIGTKILSVILFLSCVTIIGIYFLVNDFKRTDDNYSSYIANEAMAGLQISRASGGTMVAVLQVAKAAKNLDDPEMIASSKTVFEQFINTAVSRMKQAIELAPATKAASTDIINRLEGLRAIGERAFQSIERKDADGISRDTTEIYKFLDEMTPLFVANNDVMTKALTAGSDRLTVETISSITYGTIGLGLGMIIAIAGSLYVAQVGISRPINALRARMITLADGDAQSVVSGLERHDEIGKMAQSVEVFRLNALDRERLSQESRNERTAREQDREANEQAKALQAANISEAVSALGNALGKLASGNLTHRIDQAFPGDLDALRRDFNAAVTTLNSTLSAVGLNASAISAGTDHIRSSVNDLSKRTEQQAASVEETAAALEEITTTVKDAASRAKEASLLVARTRDGAEKSGTVVRDAVDAMQLIEKSSSEINNIIGVIDDIAFQTNLLALNAGVEAARAGDAGKGFAVVAQEVRELAQRSANAAKEIKSLISTSEHQVKQGVSLVGDAGNALSLIATEVMEINRHVQAIAEAAREQAIGLQEINTAVNTMDQGTQQNAAMVEETTGASHNLAIEAAELAKLMSQFQLDHSASKPEVSQTDRPRPVKSERQQEFTAAEPAPQRARAYVSSGNTALKADAEWAEF